MVETICQSRGHSQDVRALSSEPEQDFPERLTGFRSDWSERTGARMAGR